MMPRIPVTITLSERAYRALQRIPRGHRSAWIEARLRERSGGDTQRLMACLEEMIPRSMKGRSAKWGPFTIKRTGMEGEEE